jgi:hypothetical protein
MRRATKAKEPTDDPYDGIDRIFDASVRGERGATSDSRASTLLPPFPDERVARDGSQMPQRRQYVASPSYRAYALTVCWSLRVDGRSPGADYPRRGTLNADG